MSKLEEFEALMANTAVTAERLYIEAIREVLNMCPSLDYYMDAMGTFYFVRKGEIVNSWEEKTLPKCARDLLNGIAQQHLDCFGSLGYRVWRDKLD
jgi:hypothetical protein